MLRIISNLRLLNSFPENMHNCQPVRWRRKPMWLPTAKSKVFRVPPRPQISEEEDNELKRLNNNYRTAMNSIRRYLTNRYSVKLQAKADTEQLKKAFEEDLARCKAINDEWNAELEKVRNERIAKQLEEDIKFAENRKLELLKREEEMLAQAEEIVRKEKELVGTFITPEMLDEAIENAINNPVDYNFAIDLEGNKILGRETTPVEKAQVKQ
ncbi:small ribosomal subunit protein mS26 [Tribolium castaneum]|uniref:Small ribosomal subunit protein mS26 n=1 Tax=Tribolium castaneum TaxID=7070 RepID=D6WLW4_TRICA|nr:PREDICTED: probable 28S ribosomal protein S26, mitochondrial [Tribolium castaneum]EFA03392.1 putative 28S ribosomal protein S26, mitochondrial-like Protein [Tribolium castaneum]|eukprot:XP_974439.3 PREDICTED: probable 28S ribosomal protein S26, mitochondrial [Tribolium castaneum]